MGFLTNLIRQKHETALDDAMSNARMSKMVIDHPDAHPDDKAMAMQNLIKSSGLSKKEGDNLLHIMTALTGGASTVMGNDFDGQQQIPQDAPAASSPALATSEPSPSFDFQGPIQPIKPQYDRSSPAYRQQHPIRNFLIQTLAGGLSGGRTAEYSLQRRRDERQAELQSQAQLAAEQRAEQRQIEAENRQQQRATGPDAIDFEVRKRTALDTLDIKKAVDIARQTGTLKSEEDWAKFDMDLKKVQKLMDGGATKDQAFEAVFPGYSRGSTSTIPVEQQEMSDWLSKNPGKGPSDWYAFKQSQGGEPLYPVMINGVPTLQPRSQASGKPTPTTIYQPSGLPTVAGIPGLSTQAPPPVPDITQANLAGWKQSISQIDRIVPQLEAQKNTLGPLAGRVKLAEIGRLGGMGATPQQISLAVQLRRLLMSQAFAEGGKQLTPTEKEEFVFINPTLSDTFEQAIEKAKLSREYLQQRYDERISAMPVRERMQMTSGNDTSNIDRPKPPRPGAALDAKTAQIYVQLSKGDNAEATRMATEDGWSVK